MKKWLAWLAGIAATVISGLIIWWLTEAPRNGVPEHLTSQPSSELQSKMPRETAPSKEARLLKETEPNDDIYSPNILPIGRTIRGSVALGEIDFYRFDLPNDGNVRIVFRVIEWTDNPFSSANYGLALYDAFKAKIWTDTNIVPTDVNRVFYLKKGSYSVSAKISLALGPGENIPMTYELEVFSNQ